MRSVVLIKQVPDSYGPIQLDSRTGRIHRASGEQVFDEVSERALEVALQQREEHGGDVIALTMGPSQAIETLRKALAMGADSGVHILDDCLEGADSLLTSEVLTGALRRLGFDLVVAGDTSSDGRGGVVPAMIAERLGVAQATYLSEVTVVGDAVVGERSTDFGTQKVRAPLPAVLSVTEKSAEPRYPNFRGIMKAKKKPVQVWSAAELGVECPPASSQVASVSPRPTRQAGVRVVDDGTAARQLVGFLSTSGLLQRGVNHG